jgi:hypothetical protein
MLRGGEAAEPRLRLKPPHKWTPEERGVWAVTTDGILMLCGERGMKHLWLNWTWKALQEVVKWWLASWFAEEDDFYSDPRVRAALPGIWRWTIEQRAEAVRGQYDRKLIDAGLVPLRRSETLFVYALHELLQWNSPGRTLNIPRLVILLRGVEDLRKLRELKRTRDFWIWKARTDGLPEGIAESQIDYCLVRLVCAVRERASELPPRVLALTTAHEPPFGYIYDQQLLFPMIITFATSYTGTVKAVVAEEDRLLAEKTRGWGCGTLPRQIVGGGGQLLPAYFNTAFERSVRDAQIEHAGVGKADFAEEDEQDGQKLRILSLDQREESSGDGSAMNPTEPEDPAALDALQEVLDRRAFEGMRSALERGLTQKQFAAFWLVDVQGITQRQVADLWGVSPADVCQLRQKARRKAQKIIEKM